MQIESGVGINADWYWEAQNILEGRKGTRARTEAGQVGMRRRPADLQAEVDEMHQETYMDTHIECGGDEDVAGAGVRRRRSLRGFRCRGSLEASGHAGG
jgi:hypothetical protein